MQLKGSMHIFARKMILTRSIIYFEKILSCATNGGKSMTLTTPMTDITSSMPGKYITKEALL